MDDRIPKLCGADIELGNFILGPRPVADGARLASRALLREIDAPYAGRDEAGGTNPQDWGRKYLAANGGCFYIDLDHLECCVPEAMSAHDHVAAWHAMLRIARHALSRANAALPEGQSIHVLVNNSDGRGNAYGSHVNVLIGRRTWDNVFERKMHQLLYLAAFQISSIVFTGQGKVGAENGMPDVAFQLAQRADFFETLVGVQTTYRRPIVNSRDEALCGWPSAAAARGAAAPASRLARLHCIFYDNTLRHGSTLLKVGTLQMILAMLEAERVNPDLLVDDPVTTLVRWSHDPTLAARASTVSGRSLTAIELQMLFLEEAQRFAATGGFDGVVPRAPELLALWEDTLVKLRAGDLDALAPRLDWVAKLQLLLRALERRPDLHWAGPELKHLDHLYGSLDASEGLYWGAERRGAVERHVAEADVARFEREPPEDTRAWGRAMLLRRGAQQVQDVDWERIRFRQGGRGYWPTLRTLDLDDPLGFTRSAIGDVVEQTETLEELLDALGASPSTVDTTPTLRQWRDAEDGPDARGSRPRRRDGERRGNGWHGWDDA